MCSDVTSKIIFLEKWYNSQTAIFVYDVAHVINLTSWNYFSRNITVGSTEAETNVIYL